MPCPHLFPLPQAISSAGNYSLYLQYKRQLSKPHLSSEHLAFVSLQGQIFWSSLTNTLLQFIYMEGNYTDNPRRNQHRYQLSRELLKEFYLSLPQVCGLNPLSRIFTYLEQLIHIKSNIKVGQDLVQLLKQIWGKEGRREGEKENRK